MDNNTQKIQKTGSSGVHADRQSKLRELSEEMAPAFPLATWNNNNSLMFTDRITLSRILYFDRLYQKILGNTGIICEFGIQFGATLALLTNLRGIYEPYNYLRRIVGFDTFTGFTGDLCEQEQALGWEEGDFSVPGDYVQKLEEILATHELYSPISHRKKFELVKGDVTKTLDTWLDDNPSTIIALAIIDMDVYAPTKHVLERILDRMPKGAILAFDELNMPLFPGETMAVRDVLGIPNLRLHTDPNNPSQAWHVVE